MLDLEDEGTVVILNVRSHFPNNWPSSSALLSQPLMIPITADVISCSLKFNNKRA